MQHQFTAPQDGAPSMSVQDSVRALIYRALSAALESCDEASLRSLVPDLTKKEAATLFFHTSRRARRSSSRQATYGRNIWGAAVPAVVLSATRKMRIAGLLSWCEMECYALSHADVARLVEANMAREIEQGEFWKSPIYAASVSDLRDGAHLWRARRQAQTSALIFEYRDDLRAAYEAAQHVLTVAGLPFELLAAWHQGNHGEQQQAASA